MEWIRKYNPDTLLLDDSYRKHLKHQCNKSVKPSTLFLCLCAHVFGFSHKFKNKTSYLPLQGVAEGAYALLPETGSDWRTCWLCTERGWHQVFNRAIKPSHTYTLTCTCRFTVKFTLEHSQIFVFFFQGSWYLDAWDGAAGGSSRMVGHWGRSLTACWCIQTWYDSFRRLGCLELKQRCKRV